MKVSHGSAYAGLLGLGVYRPSRVVTNDEVAGPIDSSDEWIRTRSGIVERRWATAEETPGVMALAAARDAIADAGIDARQVDCVVVATVSHLLQTPSLAATLAHELGTDQAAAFDISAACAGFCHGIALAQDMVRGGTARHVLVIGVERLSEITSPTDRGTAFIFADGAGAAVVGPSDVPAIGPVVWGSDGERADLIRTEPALPEAVATGVMPTLRMDGNPVFRWASYAMAKVGLEALDRAGVAVDELDCFVPHQANERIIDAMARAMKLPATTRIARDIVTAGNTSAASVPLALQRLREDGQARSGDTALLIAFGAGLTYAAQTVLIP